MSNVRPFPPGEIDRIRAMHESTMGAITNVGFTAVVKSQDLATTKITALACSNLNPMDGTAKERAQMATVKRAYTCECEINTALSPRMQLFDGTVQYYIHDMVPTPYNNPFYYVLLLERINAS
ncbi:MAG: hypothetical protein GY938_12765 [Ketobacter sp.]|nr:hypothetical protein [Ketobacter sp.]